jgi:hypothetical protein
VDRIDAEPERLQRRRAEQHERAWAATENHRGGLDIVDADVGLGHGNDGTGPVGVVDRAVTGRRDSDTGENLFRDLGEQGPGVDESLQLDPALGYQRMADHELDRERSHRGAIVGVGPAATQCHEWDTSRA